MSIRDFLDQNMAFTIDNIVCNNIDVDTINGVPPSSGGSGSNNLTTDLNMNNNDINNVQKIYFSDSGGIHDITVSSGVLQFDGVSVQFQNDDINVGGNTIHDVGKLGFTQGNDTVFLEADSSNNLYYNDVQLATINDVNKGEFVPLASSNLNMSNFNINNCATLNCGKINIGVSTMRPYFIVSASLFPDIPDYTFNLPVQVSQGSMLYLKGTCIIYFQNTTTSACYAFESYFKNNGVNNITCMIPNGNLRTVYDPNTASLQSLAFTVIGGNVIQVTATPMGNSPGNPYFTMFIETDTIIAGQ
jgi:hypothetical protein